MAISHSNVLHLIGNTPLVKISHLDTGLCELYVKLESQNPGGSIKDRIGRSMIEAAQRMGQINADSVLVEATTGNTGLGLALMAAQKGLRLVLVVPDNMSQEKVVHLKALGAQVVMTRSDVERGHPQHYRDLAEKIARETVHAYYVNQFQNPANPLAHETTTGPEIWMQMEKRLDAVVCGVGSGGTLTGLSKFFSRTAPDVQMVLADPQGSVLADYVRTGQIGQAGTWLVEGIGEDFVPPLADLSRVRQAISICDHESLRTARDLLRHEGILAGSSSGTLVAAALQFCRQQTTAKRVVTFICDAGNKSLSKMFNDSWMTTQQGGGAPGYGDLRDLIVRRFVDGTVISLNPNDNASIAYARMRLYDVSQIPVVEETEVVGIIDESDLLLMTRNEPRAFQKPVREFMTRDVQSVPRTASLTELTPIFDAGKVVIVADELGFHGLVTRIDLLNHLRRKAA